MPGISFCLFLPRSKDIIKLENIPALLQELAEAEKLGLPGINVEELEESDRDLSDQEVHVSDQDHDSESEEEGESSNDELADVEDNFFVGKDKISRWSKTPLRISRKTSQKNIIKSSPGPTNYSENVSSECESFLKLLDIEMIDCIVTWTNKYILGIKSKYQRTRNCKLTDRSEIMGLIGILFLIGIKKAHFVNVKELWDSDGTGMEILRAAMSYKRFLFLMRSLRFDDTETRSERRKTDKLAAIRHIFESFTNNLKRAYNPTEFVTIDEMLVGFRGRCSWIQYIPSKPAKYGLKLFALCDAKTFYTSGLEVYVGKQPDGPFQVSNTPADIVKRLVKNIEGSNRNITTDNWYTSCQLADDLLQKKLTLLGTLRKNKREIPPEFLAQKNQTIGISKFGFQKNKTVVSYSTKKNRSVILLSTMHDTAEVDPDTGKPIIILDYNKTKGGVDTVDKMVATYSVSRITRRWPMVIFYHMINIAGINSQILYSLSKRGEAPKYRRIFLKNLALQLSNEHMKKRTQITSLPSDVANFLKRKYSPEEPTSAAGPSSKKKKGRCHVCGRHKDTATTKTCVKCNKFTCAAHLIIEPVCIPCARHDSSDDE